MSNDQIAAQSILVSQEKINPEQGLERLALFNPDGSPVSSVAAGGIISVSAGIDWPMGELLEAFIDTPNPSPYPYCSAIFNQTVTDRNGVYQNQTGAPGTEGNQPMKKVSELPSSSALIVATYAFAPPEGEDPLFPLTGTGFVWSNTLVDDGYEWVMVVDGHKTYDLEQRITALENA